MVQLQRCAEAQGWDEAEVLLQLTMCLTGPAAQVIAAGRPCNTSAELIALLEKRFGTKDQENVYRAQLSSLRRGNGQSIRDMYAEVV